MKKWVNLFLVIMVCRFSLSYWGRLDEKARQSIIQSVACEFAQKARGKAVAYVIVNPEEWSVEIHAEFVEVKI